MPIAEHGADQLEKRPEGSNPQDGRFYEFNEQNIVTHAGKVSHKLAQDHAEREFEKYGVERRRIEATEPVSDFDKVVDKVKLLKEKPKLPPPGKEGPKKKKKKGLRPKK